MIYYRKNLFFGGKRMKNETIKIIKQRRSIRNYKETQIHDADLDQIIEAGIYAPSASGNLEKDICFTIIQNKDILDKINELAKQFARQIGIGNLEKLGSNENYNGLYNAPTLIIMSYREGTPSPEVDCSAATQNMLLAVESIGLGGCWLYFPLMAFNVNSGEELLKEINIPKGFKPYTSIIVGYKENEKIDVPKRKVENIFYLK
jgi:nitroreductase